jgi:LmbE family N-acetylglucosaminyl deacetylase
MQRILFGIFAHPDDESFGPSATLCRATDEGTELHLLCVTAGQHGMNMTGSSDLAGTRLAEWRAAARLMGATGLHPLGYQDGHLANYLYHEVAAKVEAVIRAACADRHELSLSLMTYDANGVTGHLDHIAVSYITSYVFQKLQVDPPAGVKVDELAYYCLSLRQRPQPDASYFVFCPAGQDMAYINRIVDVADYWDRKLEIMRQHRSQQADLDALLALGAGFHAADHFRVIHPM